MKRAMEKTLFAMAQQDVRYYLNGLLLEVEDSMLRTVASDGHRLALFEETVPGLALKHSQVIIPRKGALELARLLKDDDEAVTIELASNSLRALMDDLTFSSKLVEGRYAEYRRVLPNMTERHIMVDRAELKSALTRVSILSNEKYRGVALSVEPSVLRLKAQNPDREEAEEELAIDHVGDPFSMGFNASYLLDAVSSLESEQVTLSFAPGNTSCVLEEASDARVRYLVSPMRL
jgi:DNA polymerase-3 subunit beta